MLKLTDPRPLLAEPLALDLLNTRWRGEHAPNDLFAMDHGLDIWLAANGLTERVPASKAVLAPLREARDALLEAVADPGRSDTRVTARLDAILGHGRILRTATSRGPLDTVEVDDSARLPAWLAVDNYLSLLAQAPDRIRSCAHEACILHFFDTSQNGRRRWCSMASCGNRAKASRHYAQQQRAVTE